MRKWQIAPRLQPGEEQIDVIEEDLENSVHPGEFLHRKTARTKATLICEGIKLILTPFVGLLIAYLYGLLKPSDLHGGFVELGDKHDRVFDLFMANIFLSLGGYFFSMVACSMAIQMVGFALPLTLATPVSVILLLIHSVSHEFSLERTQQLEVVIPLALAVWLSQFLSTIYYVWKSQDFIMVREDQLFWVPSYNGKNMKKG